MSPEEVIEKYCAVFRSRPDKKYNIQFSVEGTLIRKANIDEEGWVQWDMRGYTAEEWIKKAEMLALNLEVADPKKPERKIFLKERKKNG